MTADITRSIVVFNGGCVEYCYECERLGLCRFVTETTVYTGATSASSGTDVAKYRLCDECADREVAWVRERGGTVTDGRNFCGQTRETPR